jgi:Flp pilus assembly protein TadD
MTSFHFQAVDYFQRVLGLQEDNGEVWSALGISISSIFCIDTYFP